MKKYFCDWCRKPVIKRKLNRLMMWDGDSDVFVDHELCNLCKTAVHDVIRRMRNSTKNRVKKHDKKAKNHKNIGYPKR